MKDDTSIADEFLTVRQVADRYQVSERSVRRWIAEKFLLAHHFGRAVRVSKRDLIAFERDRTA